MDNRPLISVIMGIYNCQDTLKEAIESIISQTYSEWELIMCDDGSKDETRSLAEEYTKKFPDKIQLIIHKENKGLNQTLNDCLKIAKGDYIARMDGDDISLPDRFEKEMEAFEKEPELAVVSCPMIYFDEKGDWGKGSNQGMEYPKSVQLARGTVHCHAPAIIRTEVMREVNGYTVDTRFLRVEDWNLWIKIYAAGYKGKNLSECLYKMRDDKNALRRKKYKTCIREAGCTLYAVKALKLPVYCCVYSLRPLIVGALPKNLYSFLHRLKLSSN